MANVEAIDNAIERYLNGEMSERERAEFQQQVANDPESARLLEAERLVRFAAERESERTATLVASGPDRSLLTALERTAVVGATLARRRLWGLYISLGGAALISTVLFFALHGSSSTSSEKQSVQTAPSVPTENRVAAPRTPSTTTPPATKRTPAPGADAPASAAKSATSKNIAKPAAHADREATDPAPNLNMNPPKVFTK
jgi:hypothetical protein